VYESVRIQDMPSLPVSVPLPSSILKQNVQAMSYSKAPIYGHFSNSDWADKPGKPNFAMEPTWLAKGYGSFKARGGHRKASSSSHDLEGGVRWLPKGGSRSQAFFIAELFPVAA
jgi:hypothetical protein